MSNYVKKTLYTLTMLLCTISSTAEDFSVDGIYYKITSQEERTVDVTYRGSKYDDYVEYKAKVKIPEAVTYNGIAYCVTGVGEYAFRKCSSVSMISLPNTIKSIGNYAFDGCTSLFDVNIPDNVIEIGDGAFCSCSCLSEISIPEGVTRIEYGTFYGCTLLETVNLPHSLTYIGSHVFNDCTELKTLNLFENVKEFGFEVFDGCSCDIYFYSQFPPKVATGTWKTYTRYTGVRHCLAKYQENYVAAGYDFIPDAPVISISSLNPQQESYSCEVGKIGKISILHDPIYASDPGLTFVTPNTNIIGLNNTTGDFIGLADGEAIVTVFATDGSNAKTTVKVIVGTGIEAKPLKGDMNDDGKVTVADANAIVNLFLAE